MSDDTKNKKEKDSTKIVPALPQPDPEPAANVPVERDVVFNDETHPGTMLLLDLIRIHYYLYKKQKGNKSMTAKETQELAARLSQLLHAGRKYELSGLKDVPKPFLKGTGRFFDKSIDGTFQALEYGVAKERVVTVITEQFKTIAEEPGSVAAMDVIVSSREGTRGEGEETHSAPRACDVLFLSTDSPWEDNMAYEHQSGNKNLLYVASHQVSSDTIRSEERIEAALKIVSTKADIHTGAEVVQKDPRFVIQQVQDESQNSWNELSIEDVVEFAALFAFEVYLEKQIHRLGPSGMAVSMNSVAHEVVKPSETPVDAPTTHDVLFGRGGMTNGHPGNRRFRDIIALHRPDYIKATKMDKPNVARRIVRAIRHGNPPGRFLKKSEDGNWRDVGDKVASEKTSQGLRERSNTEKRQRSAMREALRIRKEDMSEGDDGEPASKRTKSEDGGASASIADGPLDIASVIPLSLRMNDKKSKKGKKGAKDDDSGGIDLPPNAVDEKGNILVTDHDILCGRGGLTNHHKGNKRFRDIVALHRPDYVRAAKVQKPSVARVIVRAIRNGDPPGRFLRKDEKTGKWIDIGDKKAAEKTSQALREKTNEEKAGGPAPGVPAGFTSPTLLIPGTDGAAAPAAAVKGEEDTQAKPEEQEDAVEV